MGCSIQDLYYWDPGYALPFGYVLAVSSATRRNRHQKFYPEIVPSRSASVPGDIGFDTVIEEPTVFIRCATGGAGDLDITYRCGDRDIVSVVEGIPVAADIQQIHAAGTTATGITIIRW